MNKILFIGFLALTLLVPVLAQAQESALSQEALVNLAKPSVVHIATHVTGTAKIPEVKVDIKRRFVALVPNKYTEVSIDEYLSGSGFVIQENGFIATNAHVVSEETVKVSLASESALSALFENALFLSDAEMQAFLDEEQNNFGKEVLQYVQENSMFDIHSKISVLKPEARATTQADLVEEGFPAEIIALNEKFVDDQRDIAIIKIAEDHLPALTIGNPDEVAVGKKVFILGFPATAELNQNNPAESTFTQGVVSAFRESGDKSLRVFQTDAKVSQGSSGGPLLNEKGEVIGIITFQTDELNRASGDNFAFALPISILRDMAGDERLDLSEGEYGRNFRKGFQEYLLRRCDRAHTFFTAAREGTHADFLPEKYTASYVEQCASWQLSGTSRDSTFALLGEKVQGFNVPLFYLIGGSLLFIGIFSGAFLWLLRQLRRDEHEIDLLERRLREDEKRMGYPGKQDVSKEDINKVI